MSVRKKTSEPEGSEGRYLSMAKRIGFISKSKLTSRNGDIRLDWNKKLNKPRMGMVADLEEEACGKKNPIQTLVENPLSDESSCDDFNVDPFETLVRTVSQDVSQYIPSSIVREEDSFSQDEERLNRTFHFVKENEIECNDDLEEDCGHDLDLNNSNILIRIGQDEFEHNNNQEMSDDRAEEDLEEMTVLDKIEAIQKIDRKLLTIEKERSRKLKKGYKIQKQRVESPAIAERRGRRRRRRVSSSSSSSGSSSSSSETGSDSSSDSEAGNRQRVAVPAKRKSTGQSLGRNREKKEVDLKEKLKHYLKRAKKRRR